MKHKNRFLNFWESKQVANPFGAVTKHYVPHTEEKKEPTFEERIEEAREELISDLDRYEEVLNTENIEEPAIDIPVEHDHIEDDGTEMEIVEINTTEEEKEIIEEFLETETAEIEEEVVDSVEEPIIEEPIVEEAPETEIVEEPIVEEVVEEVKPKRGRKKKTETTEETITE